MKKIYLFLAIFVLSFVFLGQCLAADNLLYNPGFEESFNDWEDLWGAPSDLSDTVYHTGSFSAVKYVETVYDQAYWSQVYQEVEFNPGEPVYASIYIKTTFSPQATARAGLMLQFMDDDDNLLGGTIKGRDIGGQNDWTLVELTAASAPAGTTKARLSGYIWAAKDDDLSLDGEVYFDDAFLIKEYRPIGPQTQLLNPGFENGLVNWQELHGYPATLSTAVVHSGTYAAQKTVETVYERDYWSQSYQDIVCAPGKKVTTTLYVKTEFARRAKAKAGFQLELLDSNNRVLKKYTSSKLGGVTNWRNLTIKITKTPSRTAKVRFSAFIYAPMGNKLSVGGTAYFDDATLVIK